MLPSILYCLSTSFYIYYCTVRRLFDQLGQRGGALVTPTIGVTPAQHPSSTPLFFFVVIGRNSFCSFPPQLLLHHSSLHQEERVQQLEAHSASPPTGSIQKPTLNEPKFLRRLQTRVMGTIYFFSRTNHWQLFFYDPFRFPKQPSYDKVSYIFFSFRPCHHVRELSNRILSGCTSLSGLKEIL